MAKLSEFSNCNSEQENIEKKVEEYKTMNEVQLKNELFKQVAKQKHEGKFDINALRGMAEQVRGIIGEDSYKNVCTLLEEIDD